MADLLERPLVYSVIGAFHDVYTYYGFGLIEAVYAGALELELRDRGHEVCRELAVEIGYKGQHVCWQRLDMVVDNRVVLEVKSGNSSILASVITRLRNAIQPDPEELPCVSLV